MEVEEDSTYRLVAEIVPEFNPSKYLLALTDEHTIILLMLTGGSAILPDGTIQIHSATPGVVVITPKTMRRMKSKVFVGADALVSVATEERELGGPWRQVMVPVAIPRTLLHDDVETLDRLASGAPLTDGVHAPSTRHVSGPAQMTP